MTGSQLGISSTIFPYSQKIDKLTLLKINYILSGLKHCWKTESSFFSLGQGSQGPWTVFIAVGRTLPRSATSRINQAAAPGTFCCCLLCSIQHEFFFSLRLHTSSHTGSFSLWPNYHLFFTKLSLIAVLGQLYFSIW